MRRIKTFSGRSHRELASKIAQRLGLSLGNVKLGMTKTFETHVALQESVREEDVYIVQSCAGNVNDFLMELLVMIHDCKFASAQRITAVLPYLPYCKQSKKKHARGGVTAKLIANVLEMAGVNHIVTIDLHASQIQGFFNIPVDNLLAESSIADYLKQNIDYIETAVVVAKNTGAAKRVMLWMDRHLL
jgi:ribose-phosphate pyrophosphokinase